MLSINLGASYSSTFQSLPKCDNIDSIMLKLQIIKFRLDEIIRLYRH